MDLFELSATLGLDTSAFESGIGRVGNWALGKLKTLAEDAAKLAVDFGKDVIQTGMGFDKEMSAVRAVLGETEGTLENMNRLREFALEQSRDSVFTAEESAKAYYYMGMAGWKTEQMIAGLPAIMNLAAASGEDFAMVSDIVTDSITAFKLTADDAQHYVNILAQTATNSNTDVRRMGETFKYVAPIAGTLGYSVEDVALSIGLLASAGIKGSQAGTTLRNIFQRVATNAGATSKDIGALSVLTTKLGVEFYTSTGKARPWIEVLTEARAAWRGMSEEERTDIFKKYADGAIDGADALEQFQKDTEKVQELLKRQENTKSDDAFEHYGQQILDITSQYTDLLELLDIPVNMDANTYNAYDLAEALDKARIKLGLMGDQEKIYFAKQVGSLRGMAGFIRLLEAEDDELNKLTEAYINAEGAAQRMADVRRDDLWGDISRFNSEYDHLKNRIYDSAKGPLRSLVQAATSSLKEVTDTYMSDGWNAAVDKAFQSLTILWEEYGKPIADKLGPVIGNTIIKGLDWVNTEGGKIISDIAATFAGGLWDGIVKKVKGEGTSHGGLLDTWTFGFAGQLFGPGNSPGEDYELGNVDGALGYVEKGTGNGIGETDLRGWLSGLFGGDTYGTMSPIIVPEIDVGAIAQEFADAGEEGGTEMIAALPTDHLASAISDAGQEGGAGAGMSIVSAIADAGQEGGALAASNIQHEIERREYHIDVFPNVLGMAGSLFGALAERHGKSMSGGTILRGATVFGMNANGQPMVGGETGPEAVVGTGSLNRMIQDSVSTTMNSLLYRLDAIVDRLNSYEPRLYLETGALVGGIANAMNSQLNDITRWRGSGRT